MSPIRKMKTVYLATNNKHKVEELSALFAGERLPIEVKGADAVGGMPEVDETESTFVGNATLKAQALADRLSDGEYALADDSGLEVDCLDGQPGVQSARFAGEDATDSANLVKLLLLIREVPEENCGAQFVCSLVFIDNQGNQDTFEGICRGRLIKEARGDNGFGYDPVFVPDGYSETFGELGWSVKSEVSHRARALRQLVDWIRREV